MEKKKVKQGLNPDENENSIKCFLFSTGNTGTRPWILEAQSISSGAHKSFSWDKFSIPRQTKRARERERDREKTRGNEFILKDQILNKFIESSELWYECITIRRKIWFSLTLYFRYNTAGGTRTVASCWNSQFRKKKKKNLFDLTTSFKLLSEVFIVIP